jgi:hypothetical protein
MNQSTNLFFSEDEIEAVDMEIETLLLARKRQESQQQPIEPVERPQPLQPRSETPVASRPSPAPSTPSLPAVHDQTRALSHLRQSRMDTRPSPSNFRIVAAAEEPMPWPETEARTVQRKKPPSKRRYRFRFKWLIVFAIALLLWIAVIGTGYVIWQSETLLAIARFVSNLF